MAKDMIATWQWTDWWKKKACSTIKESVIIVLIECCAWIIYHAVLWMLPICMLSLSVTAVTLKAVLTFPVLMNQLFQTCNVWLSMSAVCLCGSPWTHEPEQFKQNQKVSWYCLRVCPVDGSEMRSRLLHYYAMTDYDDFFYSHCRMYIVGLSAVSVMCNLNVTIWSLTKRLMLVKVLIFLCGSLFFPRPLHYY